MSAPPPALTLDEIREVQALLAADRSEGKAETLARLGLASAEELDDAVTDRSLQAAARVRGVLHDRVQTDTSRPRPVRADVRDAFHLVGAQPCRCLPSYLPAKPTGAPA